MYSSVEEMRSIKSCIDYIASGAAFLIKSGAAMAWEMPYYPEFSKTLEVLIKWQEKNGRKREYI